MRDIVTRNDRAALSDVHGTWLVAIVSGPISPTDRFLKEILVAFADGPVVVGPTAPTLSAAHLSATEAIAGMNAVAGWSGAPRPVSARELLPERALLGDATAIAALETEVMRPLGDAGPALTETLDAYLDAGARSRRAPVNCSFIQIPSATGSNGSPTSPGATPPCRAMPTCSGWPPPSAGSTGKRPSPAGRVGHPRRSRPRGRPVRPSTAADEMLRPDLAGVASHAVLWTCYKT